MITMNVNRKRLVGEMYDYVRKLVDKCIQNDWEIVIWGFGRCGKFFRHLIQDIDGRMKVNFIIDEKLRYVYDSEPAIYKSSLLNYIDSSKCMILSSIKDMEQIEGTLQDYGYHKCENLYDVYADIGESYIEFLRKNNKILDFGDIEKKDMKDIGAGCNEYRPFSHACADKVFEEITALDDNLSFFDFGCGKGAAIIMAYLAGISKMGGGGTGKKCI